MVNISYAQNAPCSSTTATHSQNPLEQGEGFPSPVVPRILQLSLQMEEGFNSYLLRDWPLCLHLDHNVAVTRMYLCMTMTRSGIR